MQHYLMPHRRKVHIAGEDRGFLAKVRTAISIPTTTDVNSKCHVTCSLFYTAAVTLPFATSVVFWLVLYRSNTSLGPRAVAGPLPVDQAVEAYSFSGKLLREFLDINLNAVNSIIALVEIMLLGSVRKQKVSSQSNCERPRRKLTYQQPFGTHIVGLLVITIVYLVWASVFGHLITGKFVYKFLDPLYNGWTAIFLVVVGMLSLVAIMFLVQQGLHSWRERLSWKAECDRRGH